MMYAKLQFRPFVPLTHLLGGGFSNRKARLKAEETGRNFVL